MVDRAQRDGRMNGGSEVWVRGMSAEGGVCPPPLTRDRIHYIISVRTDRRPMRTGMTRFSFRTNRFRYVGDAQLYQKKTVMKTSETRTVTDTVL